MVMWLRLALARWIASTSGRPVLIVVGLAGVLAWAPAMASANPVALVTSQQSNNVTPFSATTNTPGTAIAFGNTSNGIAVTPNGQTAYVTSVSAGTVTPITVASESLGSPITVGSGPYGIAITPNGQNVYVTNEVSNTVSVISGNAVIATISVGSEPVGIAISPNGQTAYVTNEISGTVSVISTASNTVTATISVGTHPLGVAITPDGSTAYVANESSNTVSKISTSTNSVTSTLSIGSGPAGVAVTPDGVTLYVTNLFINTVSAVSTSTGSVTATISTGAGPRSITLTADGATAYVANVSGNTVTPINTSTNAAGSAITVGNAPVAIAIANVAAPGSTTAPAISGTATAGQSLSASTGTWTNSPTGYAYQWQDCDSSGSGCTNITGATASSYTLTSSDVGDTLKVVVTATNLGGFTNSTSAATAVVTPPAPSSTTAPAISGTTTAGQSLSASTGTWTNSPTGYAYQWQDCDSFGASCTNITGATASSYTLTSSDVGDTVSVVVTATNSGGSMNSNSAATAVVTPPAPSSTTAPAISGTTTAGQSLSASTGTWTSSPTGYAYQWQDCDSSDSGCTNITGATSSSYTLTAADAGHAVRVVVTATNGGGSTQANSAATTLLPTVSSPPTTTTGSPPTTGTTTTPTTGTPSPGAGDGVSLSDQAAKAGVDVSGASALQLPLVCPHTAAGCDANGNLALALALSGASSLAVIADAQTPVTSSVIARFAGVQIQTGRSRLVSVKLTSTATRYLQVRRIRRVRVTLTIHNHLSGGPVITTTQRLWLNIAALRASCQAAVGTMTGSSIGQMRLGLTRGQAHRLGRYRKARYGFERYCLTAGGIRVAYPGRRLLDLLSAARRHQQAGRVYLALTANTHYAISGVHARSTVAAAKRRLALGTGLRVGKNTWYLVRTTKAAWVLKAQKGIIDEIGITSLSLTSTPHARRLLLPL